MPRVALRTLSEEELAKYRRPFANPGEDRRPTLAWAQENPLDGEPADVTEIENSYSEWLAHSSVHKMRERAGRVRHMRPRRGPRGPCRRRSKTEQ